MIVPSIKRFLKDDREKLTSVVNEHKYVQTEVMFNKNKKNATRISGTRINNIAVFQREKGDTITFEAFNWSGEKGCNYVVESNIKRAIRNLSATTDEKRDNIYV